MLFFSSPSVYCLLLLEDTLLNQNRLFLYYLGSIPFHPPCLTPMDAVTPFLLYTNLPPSCEWLNALVVILARCFLVFLRFLCYVVNFMLGSCSRSFVYYLICIDLRLLQSKVLFPFGIFGVIKYPDNLNERFVMTTTPGSNRIHCYTRTNE